MSWIKDLLYATMRANGENVPGDYTGEEYETSQNEQESNQTAPGMGGGNLPKGDEPYKQLVTDSNGNTVWEDRLAFKTESREVYRPEETVEMYVPSNGNPYATMDTDAINLVVGEKYILIVDGVEYPFVAIDGTEMAGGRKTVVLADLANPAVAYMEYENAAGATPPYFANLNYPDVGTHIVSIMKVAETIKPIDPPFLGGWKALGEKTENVTLTFDGNTDGLETEVVNDNFSLVKISDDIPAKENMIGAVLTSPNGNITVTENDIIDQGDSVYTVTELMMVVSDYTLITDFPVSSNGIWIAKSGETYLTKIEYTSTVYTPIPKPYLPEDIGGGGGGVLRVLVTQNEDETYSASHTYTEIEEAFFAGKVVECIYRNWIFALAVMPGASGYVTYGAALPITFTVMIPNKTAPYYISIAGNDEVTVNTGE